jgi:hypothetical protein
MGHEVFSNRSRYASKSSHNTTPAAKQHTGIQSDSVKACISENVLKKIKCKKC